MTRTDWRPDQFEHRAICPHNFSNLLFTSGGSGGAAAYTASYGNDIDLNSTGSTGANEFTSGHRLRLSHGRSSHSTASSRARATPN